MRGADLMTQRYRMLISSAALLGCSMPAVAQFRCDCTQIVDSCKADVSVVGSSIQINSDHKQCSRVDYFIDGQPFVSVAVDGEARESRPASIGAPRILVQSCQVCADRASGVASTTSSRAPSPSTPAASPQNPGELQAQIQVQPTYPAAALPRRLTGYVEVEFTVNADGHVGSASVAKSEPGKVFDSAALAAIGRWRYPAEPGREPVKLTHRFEFRPPAEASAAGGAAPQAAAGEGAPRSQPTAGSARNDCVRAGPVFDYGEVIEVGLQSTCAQPLMLFTCAVGSGGYQGRWLCTDATEQASLLVPPGDARLGRSISVTTEDGVRPLTYKDRFFVSRAPNTEYWWLACGLDDAQCRSSARLWMRAVDRQLASVNPQGRSALELARSH
jgi:TonB family protein